MANFLNELPEKLQNIALKENLKTADEVLTISTSKLLLFQGCTEDDIKKLKEAAAKAIAPKAVPVSALLKSPLAEKWSSISFGCAALDRCTGGIVTRGITEICGVSGAGKTQLLLQLALTVQLPNSLGGLGKGVAFICTEDAFPSKRLFQISKHFEKRFPDQNINYMSNIYVEHVLESEELLKCVLERLDKLMESSRIGLIIIDSVAAVFRVQTDYIQRAQDMRKMANCLLRYADKYHCAVICINQVTTISEKEKDVPCLGLAWAHLGRTRLQVSRVPKEVVINGDLYSYRKLELVYSPERPSDYAEFLITAEGVIDVPGSLNNCNKNS